MMHAVAMSSKAQETAVPAMRWDMTPVDRVYALDATPLASGTFGKVYNARAREDTVPGFGVSLVAKRNLVHRSSHERMYTLEAHIMRTLTDGMPAASRPAGNGTAAEDDNDGDETKGDMPAPRRRPRTRVRALEKCGCWGCRDV